MSFDHEAHSIAGGGSGYTLDGDPQTLRDRLSRFPIVIPGTPMTAADRAEAMRRGEDLRDGYGRPLTRNARGEWVNDGGDTPCPNDGEMTNRRCWLCGWRRPDDVA